MANPALNEITFSKLGSHITDEKMEISGKVNKTGILILSLILGAVVGWQVIHNSFILLSRVFVFLNPMTLNQSMLLMMNCLMMLLFCRSRILIVSEKIQNLIFTATFAVGATFIVDQSIRLFHLNITSIDESTPFGVALSIGVILFAAIRLLIDFQNIEMMLQQDVPKDFKWFFAFGLFVTLVWLYLEIFRIFVRINKRK